MLRFRPVLSGRQIRTDEAVKLMALPQQAENMTVLASKAGAPVWAMQEVEGHASSLCLITDSGVERWGTSVSILPWKAILTVASAYTLFAHSD